MLGPIEKDLHLNDSEFGTIATIFMVGYFLTAPIFGFLGDRFPRRWLIALGVAVWCAGTMLSGAAHGLAALICFRILVGVGEASYGTLSPGWIADLYPPAQRNNALSCFYSAIPVGSALGFVMGGALASAYGWRTAFLVAGIPGLLLAALLLFLREPDRGASDGGARSLADPERSRGANALAPTAHGSSIKLAAQAYLRLFAIQDYRLTVLGYVAQTFALGAFGVYGAAFLERFHHLTFAAADRFFGLALVLTGLAATVVGGYWGTAWRRRNPAGYAGVLAISGILAVPVAFAAFLVADLLGAKICLVAAMFFLFLSTGPVNTLILETVPIAERASAMAASIFAIHFLGDLWSPKLVGWLSVQMGDLRKAILVTLPVAIVCCAVFWTWLAAVQYRRSSAPAIIPK